MTNERKIRLLFKKLKFLIMSEFSTFLLNTAGVFIFTVGFVGFTLPYNFPDLGIIGIAIILKYSFGIAPSMTNLVGNIGLLLWGGRELSKRFVAWSIYNILLLSFFLEALNDVPFPVINDMFLVAIAGGIIKGIGVGMIFKTGTTAGGLDIIISVLRKRRGIEVGKYSFYLNAGIIMASYSFIGLERVLFGFIGAYVFGQTMDSMLSSFDKRRLVFVVSARTKEAVDYISEELHRGSTIMHGEGGYTGEERETIMTLLTPRQCMDLKRYLAHTQPKAFMVITEASEVLGKGFKHWKNI